MVNYPKLLMVHKKSILNAIFFNINSCGNKAIFFSMDMVLAELKQNECFINQNNALIIQKGLWKRKIIMNLAYDFRLYLRSNI